MDEIEGRSTSGSIATWDGETERRTAGEDRTAAALAGAPGTIAMTDQRRNDAVWSVDRALEPAPQPIESVAAIDRHPLHPAIVPLPIGAFVGALVADIAYSRTHDPFWARSARHLTEAGIATGLVAGTLGAIDFTGRRRIRDLPASWVHGGGNAAVLGLAVLSRMLRARDERAAVANGGLALSATMAGLLLLTGWLGGELSFRHRVGVVSRRG